MPSGIVISRTVTPRREEDEAEHPMEEFVAAGVRALVDMQTELDRLGRESLVEWELNGMPPTVWTYSRCRLSFPIAFAARPRTHAVGATRLEIARARRRAASSRSRSATNRSRLTRIKTMPARKKYELNGRVVDRATNDGAPGLCVEAWDKGSRRGDALGHAHTDVKGLFTIRFDRSASPDRRRDPQFDIFFRVFHGDELLLDTEHTLARSFEDWATPFELTVELPGRHRSRPVSRSATRETFSTATAANAASAAATPVSAEVAIHEFGQSVAATVASVQRELLRYPTEVGTYVLEEIDLNIPVRMRVDQFGQVMAATVTDSQPNDASIGQMRMRLRPVVGMPPPPPATAAPTQPLKTLNALPPDVIQRLEEQRIFSVDDLVRVSNTPAGRAALEKSDLGVPLETVMNKAAVLSLPIPPQVSEALLKTGTVEKPADLITKSPEQLAAIVQQKTNISVSKLDFLKWQQDVEQLVYVPLPSQQSPDKVDSRPDAPASTPPTTTTPVSTTPIIRPPLTSGPIISPPPPLETEFAAQPTTETIDKTDDGTTSPPVFTTKPEAEEM